MTRVIAEYVGKKTGISLKMSYLKEHYYLENPGDRISLDGDDAERIMRDNPVGLFKIIGTEEVKEHAANTTTVLTTSIIIKADDGHVIFNGTVRELCEAYTAFWRDRRIDVDPDATRAAESTGPAKGIPTAEDMLRNEVDGDLEALGPTGYKRDHSLKGDGIEGTEEPEKQEEPPINETKEQPQDAVAVVDPARDPRFVPCEEVPMFKLLKKTTSEMREYMAARFNIPEADTAAMNRMTMIKEAKVREEASQAQTN